MIPHFLYISTFVEGKTRKRDDSLAFFFFLLRYLSDMRVKIGLWLVEREGEKWKFFLRCNFFFGRPRFAWKERERERRDFYDIWRHDSKKTVLCVVCRLAAVLLRFFFLEKNTFERLQEGVNSDVVLGVGSQVCESAVNGMSVEDGPVLSVLALVWQKDFVAEVGICDGLQGVELASFTLTDGRTPLQEGASRQDFRNLQRQNNKIINFNNCLLSLKISVAFPSTSQTNYVRFRRESK